MDSHEKTMQREMDIGTVNAAKGIVFKRFFAAMQEHGKEAPETLALKAELHNYTEILEGVRFGDKKAIKTARTSVKKFVNRCRSAVCAAV